MSPRNGNVMVAVVLVILMMAGSVGVFVLFQTIQNMNPDPHDVSRDYVFEGTVSGVDYTGKGTTTYAHETLNEHDYVLNYSIGPVSDKFLLAFTLEDKMQPKLYDHVGTGTIGEITVDIWTYDGDDKRYRLYTGGQCILYRVEITSDTMSITGNLVQEK